ncbi:MAG: hypothetical protein KGM98_00550 [Bacteroidota bacterium]|nr:hypothetical protein [Bacteroidota bacterium]
MQINFQEILPPDFDINSRVWIYQSSRVFEPAEIQVIKKKLADFASSWKSHGAQVKGFGDLLFGQFILLMADETATGVSGCSTDSSVRMIKELEKEFKVDLFDRQMLAFIINERVQLIPLSLINHSIESGLVTPNTLYFNNTILTRKELLTNWVIPVKKSWLEKRIQLVSGI